MARAMNGKAWKMSQKEAKTKPYSAPEAPPGLFLIPPPGLPPPGLQVPGFSFNKDAPVFVPGV